MTSKTIQKVAGRALDKGRTFLGTRISRYGVEEHIGINDRDRAMHTAVTGPTGTGKTNLLLWIALQDSYKTGFAFLNPKGGAINRLIARLPENRIEEVIYINPNQGSLPGINLLNPEISGSMTPAEKAHQQKIVVSSVMEMFRRLTDEWGERWPRNLRSLLSAHVALNIHRGEKNTLLDVYRCVTDSRELEQLIERISDTVTQHQLEDLNRLSRREKEPLKRRLSDLVENQTVRDMIVQPETNISFRDVLADQKILLVDVQDGRIGGWASSIIGSVVLTQLWTATAARSSLPAEKHPPYHILIDEIQEFVREADHVRRMLSQCREFNVSITAATQYLDDLDTTMEKAVLNNTSTKVVFSPGASKDLNTFSTVMNGISKDELRQLGKYRPAVQTPAEKTAPLTVLIDTYPPWNTNPETVEQRRQKLHSHQKKEKEKTGIDLGDGANAGGKRHRQLLTTAKDQLEDRGFLVDLIRQGNAEEKPDGRVLLGDNTVAQLEAEHSTLSKPGKVLKNLRRGHKQGREVFFVVEEGQASKLEEIVSDPVNRRGNEHQDEQGSYSYYRLDGEPVADIEELQEAEYRVLELTGIGLEEQDEQECPEVGNQDREDLENFCLYREDGFCAALETPCVLDHNEWRTRSSSETTTGPPHTLPKKEKTTSRRSPKPPHSKTTTSPPPTKTPKNKA
jgi:DNA helicase HerA-like ATPase